MTTRACSARSIRVPEFRFSRNHAHFAVKQLSLALFTLLVAANVRADFASTSVEIRDAKSTPQEVVASKSVTEDHRKRLRIGMSTALTGPAAELGTKMRDGVLLAFKEANATSALMNYSLDLIALDDGYEPARTAPNMHRLIAEQNVLAIVGNVGTPTAITAIPIAERAATPFFGAFTGASALRNRKSNTHVINFRTSYAEETAAMVDYLIATGIKPEEICFFTQNDAFGDDGFFGALEAIRRYKNIKQSEITHARYRRNTLQVEGGLADLLLCHPTPKAVILVGTYAPCAKLIRLARDNGFKAQFLAVSFIGSEALTRNLGEYANGIIVTEVVPHVASDLPVVRQYRDAIQRFDPSLPYASASLEGYIVGRIFVKAISTIQGEVTRGSIKQALEELGEFDIGLGVPLTLGTQDHQASSEVWPMILDSNGSRPADWKNLSHD